MFFLKHLSSKQRIICGYCFCIFYAGALLLLESRLNYPLMNDDAYFYIQLTQSALDRGFAEAFRQLPDIRQFPPLLNLGMLFLARYTPLTVEQAGRWLCISSALFAACGVFFLCRQLYSRVELALVSALLCLSLPGWYRYASGILRDPLFWMETVWFFGLLLKSRQESLSCGKRGLYILLLGILGGAMMLTRKEALLFLLPGMIWFAVPPSGPQRKWLEAVWSFGGVCLLILLIALLPFLTGIDFLPWNLTMIPPMGTL